MVLSFRVGSRPPSYFGYWTTSTGPYMTDLIRIRSGRPYIADTFPADTIPTTCEGERLPGPVGSWAVPAVYEPVGNGSPLFWRGLSSGCSSRLTIHLYCSNMFAFTYEKCDGRYRLHIRYNDVSYPLRWRRTTWTEIGIRIAF